MFRFLSELSAIPLFKGLGEGSLCPNFSSAISHYAFYGHIGRGNFPAKGTFYDDGYNL